MTGESLRALALIFTIPLIMAGGKFSEKRIFPIFLDEAAVTRANADATNIDITTSINNFNQASGGAVTPILADGTVNGQIMKLYMIAGSGSNKSTITITTPRAGEFNTILLDAAAERVELMWTPDGWVVLSFDGATLTTA